MNIQDFDTYRLEELNEININGLRPESMTVPYNCEYVKDKRFSKNLINENQVFVISTQKKNPLYHFKKGQKAVLAGPFFETKAECIGNIEFIHKGFRMQGYFFQWR